jgi:hypothetical protein
MKDIHKDNQRKVYALNNIYSRLMGERRGKGIAKDDSDEERKG